jgi:hypothetical protein
VDKPVFNLSYFTQSHYLAKRLVKLTKNWSAIFQPPLEAIAGMTHHPLA